MNSQLNKEVFFQQLSLIDYQRAWNYQEKLFAEIVQLKIHNRRSEPADQLITPNYLLFCQHPHVYTLGKNGKLAHLLADAETLVKLQASFYHINRGGDITYHGPGQIVGYPILDLDNFFTDIHVYLRLLEEAVILTLAEYSIQAGRIPGLTGVWIGTDNPASARKICAIGVKTSRWVTMHGFALNVNTDLSYFKYIVPCGIEDKAVTSMQQELGRLQNISAVEQKLLYHLSNLFQMQIRVQHKLEHHV